MILSFKPQFVGKILSGEKIHTIREDKTGRWKEGMKIHFWCGNPRNPSKNPYQFKEGICTGVQDIAFDVLDCKDIQDTNYALFIDTKEKIYKGVKDVDLISGSISIWKDKIKQLYDDSDVIINMAKNDGFDRVADFLNFFTINDYGIFEGKIIHWTDLRY
jgi:hypothetical protein